MESRTRRRMADQPNARAARHRVGRIGHPDSPATVPAACAATRPSDGRLHADSLSKSRTALRRRPHISLAGGGQK
jgi:hypothetical protein